MLPRLLLRVKRTVRHWARPEESARSGAENEASWRAMIDRLGHPETEAERRMAEIERELNRLGLG